MPAQRVTFSGVRLPSITGFLGDLGSSGCLHLEQGGWMGDLWLDGGRVVASAFGTEQGLAALDAIALALALPEARFSAGEAPAAGAPREVDLPIGEVLDRMQELADRHGDTASLTGVRWSVEPPPALSASEAVGAGPGARRTPRARPGLGAEPGEGPDSLALDQATLRALLAINRGRGTAQELAGGLGLAEALAALAQLRDLGLIRPEGSVELNGGPVEAPPAAPPRPAVPDPSPAAGRTGAATAEAEAGGPAAPGAPPRANRFVPSAEWQEVPPGTALPAGGEYRMELGGKVFARWPEGVLEHRSPEIGGEGVGGSGGEQAP